VWIVPPRLAPGKSPSNPKQGAGAVVQSKH
jgi:hypothetical protein